MPNFLLRRCGALILPASAAAALALSTLSASASLVTFTGSDAGAGPAAPTPNSTAAQAQFAAAAGAIGASSTITFEGAPVGAFSSLAAAPGVTVTGADIVGANQNILNQPGSVYYNASNASLYGFNTTASGTEYLNLYGGSATFSFAAPVQFFGAFFTGVQLDSETITFSDNSTQSVAIAGINGGVEFVGFTDAGASISSVTVNATNDIIGVDDVTYGPSSVAATPEPESIVLCLTGLAGVTGAVRRRSSL